MLGGILWILAVVAVWATIFVLSLFFARETARSHDRETALDVEAGQAHDEMAGATMHEMAKAS